MFLSGLLTIQVPLGHRGPDRFPRSTRGYRRKRCFRFNPPGTADLADMIKHSEMGQSKVMEEKFLHDVDLRTIIVADKSPAELVTAVNTRVKMCLDIHGHLITDDTQVSFYMAAARAVPHYAEVQNAISIKVTTDISKNADMQNMLDVEIYRESVGQGEMIFDNTMFKDFDTFTDTKKAKCLSIIGQSELLSSGENIQTAMQPVHEAIHATRRCITDCRTANVFRRSHLAKSIC